MFLGVLSLSASWAGLHNSGKKISGLCSELLWETQKTNCIGRGFSVCHPYCWNRNGLRGCQCKERGLQACIRR